MSDFNLPEKDDAPWLNLSQEEVKQLRYNKRELTQYGKQKIKQLMMNQEPYPDEMFEEAERRELANKSFEELTNDEKIKLALEEVDWIVIGGQDGEEFYGSIQFIRKVLRSLRTPEQPSQGHTRTDLDAL
jgi:hypothetical protein